MTAMPRIAMIHALEASIEPARAAFARLWPNAYCFDLLDTSLAVDRVEAGQLDDRMFARFRVLADYVAGSTGRGGSTAGILFTCSAFGPAIDTVKAASPIPVLRANEAAFDAALDTGSSFILVVSFAPSIESLEAELRQMAAERDKPITVKTVVVNGAIDALKGGDGARHDSLVADAAASAGSCDALILGQFSLARARAEVERRTAGKVITTPASAVEALRSYVEKTRNWPAAS